MLHENNGCMINGRVIIPSDPAGVVNS